MNEIAPPLWLQAMGLALWTGLLTFATEAGLRLLGRGHLARSWLVLASAFTLVGALAIMAFAIYDIDTDTSQETGPPQVDTRDEPPPPAQESQKAAVMQLLT